jgi:cyclophilin family peptidyl-prolyl cis-trans isomerase
MQMKTTFAQRHGLCFAAVLLASCGGGGGGGGGTSTATVTAMTTGAAMYGDTMLVTVSGSSLDTGLSVASPGCASMSLSKTPPNVSDASTAYYTCKVSALGAQSVSATRPGEATVMGSANFTVPPPKVRLTVANGALVAGTMDLTLAPDKAPVTVDNFLRYVKDGFYNNTIFHRVSPGFVVQGGGYRTDAARGLFDPIALEVNKGLSNVQWSVAMARVGGQGGSATSQFFINLVDNSAQLDPHAPTAPGDDGLGYAVFGNVSAGTGLVTAITAAPCAPLTLTASGTIVTQAPECTPQPLMVVTSAIQIQ